MHCVVVSEMNISERASGDVGSTAFSGEMR